MPLSGGNIEAQTTYRSPDSGDTAHEGLDGNTGSIGNLTGGQSCDILQKLKMYFSIQENVTKAEYRNNELICVLEEN